MLKNVVVKQYDLKDCGACCLLSIIKYYGGYIPLEKIKLDTFIDKNGTTAFHLINAAKSYGFDACGLKVENLDEIVLPVIAHVEVNSQFNHFVVIYKINKDKNKITIMDPSCGLVTLEIDEFFNIWQNIIIQLYPHTKIPILKKTKTITQFFFKLIPNEKYLFSKLVISSIALSLLSIITSFYFKFALQAINDNNATSLRLIIIFFVGLTIFKVIVTFIRDYYENFLNKNIDIKVMLPFLKHILSLPLNIVGNRTTGEIVTRVNEINNIKDLFSKVFVTFFLDSLLAITSIIILCYINSKLFLLLLIVATLYVIGGLIFNPIIYKKIIENIEYETNFNNEVIEKVDSILTIKNINNLDYFCKCIEYKYSQFLKHVFKFNNLIINTNFSKNILSEVGVCLVTSFGFYLISKGQLDLVTLVTFNSLLLFFFDPLKNIINLIPKITLIKASFNKISEFNALEEEHLNTPKQKFVNGDITIKNLNYSYNDYDLVCKDFNISIKKGTKVMFKGSSGCGKSTVCKLLYRLYDYKEGSIKISNINILDYHLNTIRNNITYLAQNEHLFTDTIYNNIVLDNKINPKKFHEIAKICRLDNIVKKKPLRYETMINNQALNISGGERQRIILARALIKNNPIIILDEALSEVEISLEQKIIKDICFYFKDKTLIYVSHKDDYQLFDKVINFGEINNV